MQTFLDKANAYLLPVYARPPFVLTHGKGAYVWDTQNRKYLDFSAGIAVNALGHADEEVVKVSCVPKLCRCAILVSLRFPGVSCPRTAGEPTSKLSYISAGDCAPPEGFARFWERMC